MASILQTVFFKHFVCDENVFIKNLFLYVQNCQQIITGSGNDLGPEKWTKPHILMVFSRIFLNQTIQINTNTNNVKLTWDITGDPTQPTQVAPFTNMV